MQVPSSGRRIQIGRIEATTGRNLVEMKKNSTSRHFGTGRIASAYAAGMASSKHDEGRDEHDHERVGERLREATAARSVVADVAVALERRRGASVCAVASCSVLKLVSTIQSTGKKRAGRSTQASDAERDRLPARLSPTPSLGPATRADSITSLSSSFSSPDRTPQRERRDDDRRRPRRRSRRRTPSRAPSRRRSTPGRRSTGRWSSRARRRSSASIASNAWIR